MITSVRQCGKTLLTKPQVAQLSPLVESIARFSPQLAVPCDCQFHGFGPNAPGLGMGPHLLSSQRSAVKTSPSPHGPAMLLASSNQQLMTIYPIVRRPFHKNSTGQQGPKQRPVPKLFYIQNPMTWLAIKFDFRMLRRAWDHEFNEWEFKRGTKQAVATITTLISENSFPSLHQFLASPAVASLQQDVERNWTDQQRRNIALSPEEVQLAVPRRVHFQRIVDRKFCNVDMMFIALKWADAGPASAIVLIEIIARFHREYTEGHLPDWSVTLFKVTRFNVLGN